MKTFSDSMRRLGVLLAAGIALALVACGGAKPTEAKSPVPLSLAEPLGRTNAQPPAPNTPTATNVAISEDILRACNIPDADAYFAFDSSRLTAFDHGPLIRSGSASRVARWPDDTSASWATPTRAAPGTTT